MSEAAVERTNQAFPYSGLIKSSPTACRQDRANSDLEASRDVSKCSIALCHSRRGSL
jgi:hypothetical protein